MGPMQGKASLVSEQLPFMLFAGMALAQWGKWMLTEEPCQNSQKNFKQLLAKYIRKYYIYVHLLASLSS